MGISRRRHRYRCPIPAVSSYVSLLSAAALLLLLVFALLSFLAPPPSLDHPSLSSNNRLHIAEATDEPDIIHIPDVGVKLLKNDLWSSKIAKNFYGCSNASKQYLGAEATTQHNRHLAIATSGGLNQQRTGIIDAVVAARILNATLVVPKLDQRSFWKDSSDFAEIFDVNWFISFLSKDVKIIKELPNIGRKGVRAAYTMRVPRKCTPRCYEKRVLPVLLKKHAVRLTKFDYRLANKLDTDLQKLRCRVNYHALRFANPIQEFGDKLIQRMKAKSKHFIALHLRYEPDMLAFSGCYYGGGDKEKRELGAIRKRWKTLHTRNPDKERRQGKCPLTPEEVGLMLRALGFSDDIHIYVASGEIYGGEETLAPLKRLFPNFHTKETLARKGELEPFSSFSSRMAALDFIVCDGSDAFVTNNNGNMAKILAGRRRYFGHKRTIRPNAKKLYSLFLNHKNMTWDDFSAKVHYFQRGFMGEPKEIRPGRGEFHENPSTCICETVDSKASDVSGSTSQADVSQQENTDSENLLSEGTEFKSPEDDTELNDLADGEDATFGKESLNGTDVDYDLFTKPEESELEEILSD